MDTIFVDPEGGQLAQPVHVRAAARNLSHAPAGFADEKEKERGFHSAPGRADDPPDLVGQVLQGLALLGDARVLLVMLAGTRRDLAMLVLMNGMVEPHRDDGARHLQAAELLAKPNGSHQHLAVSLRLVARSAQAMALRFSGSPPGGP
ncbi:MULTISPECIES: hypothetical protein [unclassified Bradyrhizobium]|uniref:hypothetical protein n=1 Tax=unclassified Bradyrhizobium TaxID=2631580 RepID=UPI001FF81233|nr:MULTISPECIES: hypothetical protein [unclassified Bradyrhizobium]MCK1415319.1 hypothetical protein [Bradyrhizobium sp. CW4]UPJ26560.1 hypothetical protein IVB54_33620 [Bradyrhizobium sp. CW1]